MVPNSITYQLSVSVFGERCEDCDAQSALEAFDLLSANEATYHSRARVRRFTRRISRDRHRRRADRVPQSWR
jgi:hypothetical protein